ncbi:MAG: hypothetical protein ACLR23_28135 [Clostridia bacterium]
MKLTKGDIVLFQGDSITDGNREERGSEPYSWPRLCLYGFG